MSLLFPSAGYVVTAQCRNEPIFTRLVRRYPKASTDNIHGEVIGAGTEFVDCPNCGRRYFKDSVGKFYSDRELRVEMEEQTLSEGRVREILLDNGWKRTMIAPGYIIDFERPSYPKADPPVRRNRIIIYPSFVKLITLTRLTQLMNETDVWKHGNIIASWR